MEKKDTQAVLMEYAEGTNQINVFDFITLACKYLD
jgi:hypothetical protein